MAIFNMPWAYIPDPTRGKPLFLGKLYFGVADQDPILFPKDVNLIQENGSTIVAEQPIRTNAGGVPEYNGSPVAIDLTGDYSIAIHDRNDVQVYYFANIGESQDFLQTDLRSIALDLGLLYSDIGIKLVTSAPETSLDNAEFILNRDTGEVWVLNAAIPSGSTVVSISGSTLTTNNGQFELQSTSNDEYQIAPNRISVSQMVVEGATGQPLPENGTLTSYAIGNEMALGWVVTEAVVDATKDANGNVTATSGKVRYTINKDEKGLIGVAQLFGSVMQSDGTNLTQVYADGSGITLSEDAATVWLEIDFSQSTGFFYVAGISEQRGRLEILSPNDLVLLNRPLLESLRVWNNVTASRSKGVEYTNENQYDIDVLISFFGTNNGGNFLVNGNVVAEMNAENNNSEKLNITVTVPAGATYETTIGAAQTITVWSELS